MRLEKLPLRKGVAETEREQNVMKRGNRYLNYLRGKLDRKKTKGGKGLRNNDD